MFRLVLLPTAREMDCLLIRGAGVDRIIAVIYKPLITEAINVYAHTPARINIDSPFQFRMFHIFRYLFRHSLLFV